MTILSSSDSPQPDALNSPDSALMTRREAIRRAALVLGGVALSPSLLQGVLHAQPAATRSGTARQYLTPKRFAVASAVAERIIPRTDSPGAADVGVPAFIDLMAGAYLTEAEREIFVTGLDELDAASQRSHRRDFAAASPAQQDALLARVAEISQNKEKTFFFQIKEMTVVGFFTSEQIGKNVLRYDPIPGRFNGCIPVAEVGKASWTPLR